MGIPNIVTLHPKQKSETNICNLHPKARRRATGVPNEHFSQN